MNKGKILVLLVLIFLVLRVFANTNLNRSEGVNQIYGVYKGDSKILSMKMKLKEKQTAMNSIVGRSKTENTMAGHIRPIDGIVGHSANKMTGSPNSLESILDNPVYKGSITGKQRSDEYRPRSKEILAGHFHSIPLHLNSTDKAANQYYNNMPVYASNWAVMREYSNGANIIGGHSGILSRVKRFPLAGYLAFLFLMVNTGKFMHKVPKI
jgi:hypothetical protein